MAVEEVAAHLGVTPTSVYRWVNSRGLPAHRVGRLFRFRLSEVDAWVAGHGARAADEPPGTDTERVAEPDRPVDRVAEPLAPYAGRKRLGGPDEVDAAIDEMVRIIVDRFDPERIVLFGSHARGNAGPESDVDLLVVMPFSGSKRDKQVEIRVAVHEVRIPKDILVTSPEETEKLRNVAGTVIRHALREGVILHDRNG